MKCHPFEFRIACLSLPILSFFFLLGPQISLAAPLFFLFSFGGRGQPSQIHPATTVRCMLELPPLSLLPTFFNTPHCLSRLHLSIFVRLTMAWEDHEP
jgi:hypothetical protein